MLLSSAGAGKSTVTRQLIAAMQARIPQAKCVIASADDYFVRPGVGYVHDASKLKEAHASCRATAEAALRARTPLIIVDNTNTAKWEYADYEAMVQSYNAANRPASAWTGLFKQPGTAATTGASAPAPAPAAASALPPYSVRIVEVRCPDAAHLRLFTQRNSHGVPWDVMCRQWLRWEDDARATVVSPFVNGDSDVLQIATFESLPEVRDIQRLKDAGVKEVPSSRPSQYGAASTQSPVQVRISGSGSSSRGGSPAISPWKRGGGGGGGGHSYSSPGSGQHRLSGGGRTPSDSDSPYFPPWVLHKVVYVGLFLDQPSRKRLCASVRPRFEQTYADHVTVAHSPSREHFTRELGSLVGTSIELYALDEAFDDGVQAATVSWDSGGRARSASATGTGTGASDGPEMRDASEPPPAMDSSGTVRQADTGSDRSSDDGADGDTDPASRAERRALRAACLIEALSHFPGAGMSTNGCPHITLSTARGISPASSNHLLQSGDGTVRSLPRAVPLQARLGVVVAEGGGRRQYLLRQSQFRQWLSKLS